MTITDLSQPLSPEILVYPGDDGLTMTISQENPQTTLITTGSHIGTHIDAPRHAFGNGKNINEFPLDRFYGKAMCVKPPVENGKIQRPSEEPPEDCGILVIATMWKRRTGDGKSFLLDFPGFSESLARYILDRGFRLVATDVPSVDRDSGFTIHNALLSADVPLAEGLVIPERLIGREFVFAAFPLNIGCDSSPVRAVAIED